MNQEETLHRILDNLTDRGYKALPEVEDYIAANRNNFIGISVQRETFVHRSTAWSMGNGIEPGDVWATIIFLILTESFVWAGIDGNTWTFSPVKGF